MSIVWQSGSPADMHLVDRSESDLGHSSASHKFVAYANRKLRIALTMPWL